MEADTRDHPRLLFVSYHAYPDPASGASAATRDLLEGLARRGWQCGVLCGPERDGPALPEPDIAWRTEAATDPPHSVACAVLGGVRVTRFLPDPLLLGPPSSDTSAAFVRIFRQVCSRFRPGVVLTYGGHALARDLMAHARAQGAKVAFMLHNFDYHGRELFRGVDAVVVPSQCARQHYREHLGLDCVALPNVLDPARVVAPQVEGRFVTFVNPVPAKGVFWFARIVEVLGRRRPDIPFLVVEGRGGVDWLGRCGVDLTGTTNVSRMTNTPDPRQFQALSRIVLMPSLWRESFGRVAAEAVLNGVPVIASDRGALPETLADAGVLLPIPARYSSGTRMPPSADEVRAWVEAIEHLWDDASLHRQEQQRCRAAAHRWHPDVVLPQYERLFCDLTSGTLPAPFPSKTITGR